MKFELSSMAQKRNAEFTNGEVHSLRDKDSESQNLNSKPYQYAFLYQ
jgi:hypothetical protein